jgi:hypothetical protein
MGPRCARFVQIAISCPGMRRAKIAQWHVGFNRFVLRSGSGLGRAISSAKVIRSVTFEEVKKR